MSDYINLVFVDTEKMRQLNKEYRNLDEPTSVLTFNYASDEDRSPEDSETGKKTGANGCIGEILICLEVAREKNLTVEELLSHGIKRFLPQIQATEARRT